MGKLVLFLADGTTMDVRLDRERITIGRRADNDVCLPYPAVSGEHAAVVTILADSFLEDLGSTNGTLVNGKPVAKHFLTDHDQIDIGRQRMTYMSDNDARVDPLPPDLARNQMRGLMEKVQAVRPLPPVAAPSVPASSVASAGAIPQARPVPPSPRQDEASAPASAPFRETPRDGQPQRAPVLEADPSPPVLPARSGPSVRVLSGPSQGRLVLFAGPELSVGRAGVQVAVVRRGTGGYRLVPLEGRDPPRINGAPVGPDGAPLHPGDTFEVAGVRLELSVDS